MASFGKLVKQEEEGLGPLGEVAAFCDGTDDWLPLICTLNLTLITEHVRNLFGWDYATLSLKKQIPAVPAGWDGLLLLTRSAVEQGEIRRALYRMSHRLLNPNHWARRFRARVAWPMDQWACDRRDMRMNDPREQ